MKKLAIVVFLIGIAFVLIVALYWAITTMHGYSSAMW